MKLIFLFLIAMSFSTLSYSQEFSFQMFFEDAVGNKDTITLGYDINATDSLDSLFSEVNIITTPLDTNLDVRISNEWFNRTYNSTTGTYHTKKQIVDYSCSNWYSASSIDIFTEYWPVTAYWDSSLFSDSCRKASVFTDISPGGWFDVLGPSNMDIEYMQSSNEVTFTTNVPDYQYPLANYYYINNENDTIPFFWYAFGSNSIFTFDIDEITPSDVITLSPNPVTNFIQINHDIDDLEIKQIKIFDLLGREQQVKWEDNSIDLSNISNGILFVQITLENNQSFTYKIIKE